MLHPPKFLRAALFSLVLISSTSYAHNNVVVVPILGSDSSNSGSNLSNVITVANEGGDFTKPADALESITDASASNPYLIVIAPGNYSSSSALVMKEHVNLQGSGVNATTLIRTQVAGSRDRSNSAVINVVENSTVSDLKVVNLGGSTFSYGIYIDSQTTNTRVLCENINIEVSGGISSSVGIFDQGQSRLKNIDVTISGGVAGTRNIGIEGFNNGFSIYEHISVNLSGPAGTSSIGFRLGGFIGSTLNNVTVASFGVNGEFRGMEAFGPTAEQPSHITILNSDIVGRSSVINANDAIVRIRNSRLFSFEDDITSGGATFECISSVASIGEILNTDCSIP